MKMRSMVEFLLVVPGLIGTVLVGTAQAQTSDPESAPAAAATAPADPVAQPPAPAYAPAEGAPASQEAPPPVQPAQAYDDAPPVMEARPGARLHDGFYLRMSLGVGAGSATENVSIPGSTIPEIEYSGTAMMFDILIGGSPMPGFVLGGGLVSHRILNPTVKAGGVEYSTSGNDVSLNLSTFGLFTAIYPDPKSGFNLHALVGYGVISASNGNDTSSNNPAGLSIMGGLGYDFWVGEQWSLGPDVRIAYAQGTYSAGSSEDKVSMFVPTLSFTATYH